MSMWTHIVGVIYIDTGIEDPQLKERTEKILEYAPKISGSERPADVYVNMKSGYTHSMSRDCKHCIFQHTLTCCDEGGFKCKAPEEYTCPEGRYQTRITITVEGDLRDRMKDRTQEEWEQFLEYVKDKLCSTDDDVMNVCCNIEGW